jgi:hypothetical protein
LAVGIVAARPAANRIIEVAFFLVEFLPRVPDLRRDRVLPVHGIRFAEEHGNFFFIECIGSLGFLKSNTPGYDNNHYNKQWKQYFRHDFPPLMRKFILLYV